MTARTETVPQVNAVPQVEPATIGMPMTTLAHELGHLLPFALAVPAAKVALLGMGGEGDRAHAYSQPMVSNTPPRLHAASVWCARISECGAALAGAGFDAMPLDPSLIASAVLDMLGRRTRLTPDHDDAGAYGIDVLEPEHIVLAWKLGLAVAARFDGDLVPLREKLAHSTTAIAIPACLPLVLVGAMEMPAVSISDLRMVDLAIEPPLFYGHDDGAAAVEVPATESRSLQ